MDTIKSIFDPSAYSIISAYFPRILGIIYLIAFSGLLFQIKGLIGENGILPVKNYLQFCKMRLGRRRFYYVPTLFWWNSSDPCLIWTLSVGILFALLLIITDQPILRLLLLVILGLIQLSILYAGQDFLTFGWETTLLEITYITFFLILSSPPNPFIWLSLNLLLFRLHFEGGISKLLSRDKNWRNLKGVSYHYQSQPIPHFVAWYAHKLPLWFHKFSCFMMLFIEIFVPFAIFSPPEIRFIAFLLLATLQLMILLTGNFSYLNYMTLLFLTILLGNTYLSPLLSEPKAWLLVGIDLPLSLIGIASILLQLICLWNYLFPTKRVLGRIFSAIAPFHPVNTHGIFAVMTTKRFEVVIEGSEDQIEWKEYAFFFKPSEVDKRPVWCAPYQPRLDWRMWFLPFSTYYSNFWFQQFLEKLLLGSSDVLKLIRTNPFPQKPPKYIRAVLYDYEFSDRDSKKKLGHWWKRTYVGPYSPELTLKN